VVFYVKLLDMLLILLVDVRFALSLVSFMYNSGLDEVAPAGLLRDFFVAQHVMLSFPPDACQVLEHWLKRLRN
jgi:hypothetical protein